jgi:hypothetical protein
MRFPWLAATVVLGASLLTPARAAADVTLRIEGGRVWLVAKDATVGQILGEWSRIGQTRVVNGDRVPGGRVTLQLENVSEEDALDVLLRSAAGFMGVRRTTPLAASSEFDQILILPTSRTPAATASASPRPVAAPAPVFPQPEVQPEPPFPFSQPFTPGVQRVIGPDGIPVPDDQEDAPPPQPFPGAGGFPPVPPPVDQLAPSPGSGNVRPDPRAPQVPQGVPVPGMTVPTPAPQVPQNPPADGP